MQVQQRCLITVRILGSYRILQSKRWSKLRPEPRVGVWTDDFHNLLSVLKWR